MKKLLAMLLVILFGIGSLTVSVSAAEEPVMPIYDTTVRTITNFTITDDGLAIVSVDYIGTKGDTTGAVIEIVLQKRFMLVFWNEVTAWVDTSSEYAYSTYHSTYVESGTYRVKVKYQISNSTATDVIEEEIKASY